MSEFLCDNEQTIVECVVAEITSGHDRGLENWLLSNNTVLATDDSFQETMDQFRTDMTEADSLEKVAEYTNGFFVHCVKKDPRQWDKYFSGLIAPINSDIDPNAPRAMVYSQLVKELKPQIEEAINEVCSQHLEKMQQGEAVDIFAQFCNSSAIEAYSDLYEGTYLPKDFENEYRVSFVPGVEVCAQRGDFSESVKQTVVSGEKNAVQPLHLKELERLGYVREEGIDTLGISTDFLEEASRAKKVADEWYAKCDALSPLARQRLGMHLKEGEFPDSIRSLFSRSSTDIANAFLKLDTVFPSQERLISRLFKERVLTELQSSARSRGGFSDADAQANAFLSAQVKEEVASLTSEIEDEFLSEEEKSMSFTDRIRAYQIKIASIGPDGVLDTFEKDFERELLNEFWLAMELLLVEGWNSWMGAILEKYLRDVKNVCSDSDAMTERVCIVLSRVLGVAINKDSDWVDDFIVKFTEDKQHSDGKVILETVDSYNTFTQFVYYQNAAIKMGDIDEAFLLYWSDIAADDPEEVWLRSFLDIDENDSILAGLLKQRYPTIEKA